ncbi:hypothetical protein ILYODFUR_032194 [Ilyodon furcidens]|uniref:Uncharacterized protein n=1 Tax=Ilyodon furcidens TaxID=33524 RepID=A0ABV0U0L5_9TELE
MPFVVIGHFVPQKSLLLQILAGTAADRTGCRISDFTLGYIVNELALILASKLDTGPASGAQHSGEENPTWTFIHSPPVGQREGKFMKEVFGIGRPEISLYRSKTWA